MNFNISHIAPKNKRWLLLGVVLLILILTNPTMKDFEEYKGTMDKKLVFYNLKRTANCLLFSTYDDGFTRRYIGILNNFIPIGNSTQ